MGLYRVGRGERMGQTVLVKSGDTEFWVEVAEGDEGGGVETVGLEAVLSFDGVRDTVETIAATLANVWERVRPSEASVEFSLALSVKSGRLTGLLVEGGGEASLKVNLVWKGEEVGHSKSGGSSAGS
jgi:hypothetical protein